MLAWLAGAGDPHEQRYYHCKAFTSLLLNAVLLLEPLGDRLTKVQNKQILRPLFKLRHVFFCLAKWSCVFDDPLAIVVLDKTHQDSDTLTSNYGMFEIRGFFINPGLQGPQCMAQHRTRQADHRTIDPLQKPRVYHSLNLYPIEILEIYRVGNLGRKEPQGYVLHPLISRHVKSSHLLGSDIISTGWAHKPVPFEQVINPPRKTCRIILWQIVQLGDMLPYFVHELPSHTPVLRAELPSSVPNSVKSRLPKQTYLLDTLLPGFNISSIGNLIQSLTPNYVHLGCQCSSFREWVSKKGTP